MKKIFNTIIAAAAIFAGVACTEVEKTVFRISDATAPVLGTVTEVYDAVKTDSLVSYIVEYVPGTVPEGIVAYHSVALVKANDKEVSKVLATKEVKDAQGEVIENTLSITLKEIGSGLAAVGCAAGSNATFEIAIRMSIQNSKSDNSRNGYLNSTATKSGSMVIPEATSGASPWSVIGSIASTGNGWNADEPMEINGPWHKCTGLVLTVNDQFKFRKDGEWAENFGGNLEAIGQQFDVSQDGPNIKVTEDGTFDLYLNPGAAKAVVVKTGEDGPKD